MSDRGKRGPCCGALARVGFSDRCLWGHFEVEVSSLTLLEARPEADLGHDISRRGALSDIFAD